MATSIGQYAPVFLPGEPPSLTEKPGRPQSTGLQRVRHYWSDPVRIDARLFFCLWQLCPRKSWVCRWCSCLACRDPGSAKCAGTQTASAIGPIRVFFQASCSWWSKGLFGQSFSVALPIPNLWKILKEVEIPDHLTCLLRNLYAAQKATVRTGQRTMDWLKIGKGVHQGCILSLFI